MKIYAIKTRIFKERENIYSFISDYYIPKDKDILIVTSKIAALAEGRFLDFISKKQKELLIRQESTHVRRTPYAWLTITNGLIMASAGIDESNANGKLILLPRDSFKTAKKIRQYFLKKYNLKNLGVIITDSKTIPLRAGTVGMALGYAGFYGLKKYIGTEDIFGRILKISRVDIPDSLAAGAVLLMGEGNEQKPLAVIKGYNFFTSNKNMSKELYINPSEDLYKSLF